MAGVGGADGGGRSGGNEGDDHDDDLDVMFQLTQTEENIIDRVWTAENGRPPQAYKVR